MDSAPHLTQPQQPYSISSSMLIVQDVCEPPWSHDKCLVNGNTLKDGIGYLEETHTHIDEHLCADKQA